MRFAISATSLILCLLAACPVGADESTCAPDYRGERRATVVRSGQSGTWFAEPVALCLLGDVRELALLRPRVSLLENRAVARDDQVVLLRQAVALGDRIADRAMTALERAERLRLHAEEVARGAQQATRIWTTVGFAGGVLVTVLAVWAWSALAP